MAQINSNLFLNLPPAELSYRKENNIVKVFDRLRSKYVALNPEEYVRQNFVEWLINHLHYPQSLMANEVKIDLNGTSKRCDTVIFRTDGKPLIIVEYKAPNIVVTQETFDQIARYNAVLRAEYLIVSNGINHYCCKIDQISGDYHFIPSVPDYNDLKNSFSDN